ncbi:MAG: MoxR family ATPase [Anaerococcus sp.]|nr:MoxR family ATPase [Anaerococcus sp.]
MQRQIDAFIKENKIDDSYKDRIVKPSFTYHGESVLKKAISAILAGKNILLLGNKSTGKNVLAENLAYIFKRPLWNVSFHVNVDSSLLIGLDTLKNGQVVFRDGPVTKASKSGGFLVFDEINMARNEAMAVLHSILDYRRIIDIPGYDLIKINPATRFIATMNYNYEGTRDLNEALLSRFVIIDMPLIKEDDLDLLLRENYKNLIKSYRDQINKLFFDFTLKAKAGEISDLAIDLRGIFDCLDLVKNGLSLDEALNMTIVNKIFDPYERDLVRDLIKSRFKKSLDKDDLFERPYE